MARYHINAKGEPGICRAQQACPFGGPDQHYPTKEDAARAFEAEMDASLFPVQTTTHPLKELNELAKTTAATAVFEEILERGSARTIRNLAKNPAVPGAILARAGEKVQDEATRSALTRHAHFPVEAMSGEEFAAVAKHADWERRRDLMASDGIRDEHVTAVLGKLAAGGTGINYYDALANRNNQLSQAKIVELAEKNWMSMERALVAGRYPLRERIDQVDLTTIRSALRKVESEEDLKLLTAKAVEEKNHEVLWALAANSHTPATALNEIVEATDNTDTLIAAYRSPRASTATKERAAGKHEVVASYAKLEKLDQQLHGQLGELIGSGAEKSSSYSSKSRVVQFDPEQVRSRNLSPRDVDTYVRYYRGNYLFGTSYNEKTGVYSGYID